MKTLVATVIIVSLICACDRQSAAVGTPKELEELKSRLADAEKRLEVLKSIVDLDVKKGGILEAIAQRLEKRVDAIDDVQGKMIEAQKTSDDILIGLAEKKRGPGTRRARIDPKRKSVYSVTTSLGSLLVFCESIDPYLTGHKVRLKFGNPYSATLRGLNGKFFNVASGGNERETSFHSPESLTAGAWLEVEVYVADSKASDFEKIEVETETEQISLRE